MSRPGAQAGFFLETTGLNELHSFLGELDHEMKQGLRVRLKEAAGIVAEEAKRQTHSARVRSAMSTTVTVRSLVDYEARIGPNRRRAWFAHFLEFGVRPHVMKNFFGRKGVAVQHPGARAFPFLAPALAITEDQVVEIVGFPPILQKGGS